VKLKKVRNDFADWLEMVQWTFTHKNNKEACSWLCNVAGRFEDWLRGKK